MGHKVIRETLSGGPFIPYPPRQICLPFYSYSQLFSFLSTPFQLLKWTLTVATKRSKRWRTSCRTWRYNRKVPETWRSETWECSTRCAMTMLFVELSSLYFINFLFRTAWNPFWCPISCKESCLSPRCSSGKAAKTLDSKWDHSASASTKPDSISRLSRTLQSRRTSRGANYRITSTPSWNRLWWTSVEWMRGKIW